MENIDNFSELLGILNSINYDEVINELEIETLKKWVNINSNTDDIHLIEIIEKLNKILEDNVITKEEKEEIIKITEQYDSLGHAIDNTSELVGIIQGIVADNVINMEEVTKLEDWLKKNEKLTGTYFFDRIFVVVSDVLSDGVLDEDEKQKLLLLLKFLLKDNDIEQKISSIRRTLNKGEIIGNQLISLIDDSTMINKINKKASHELEMLFKKGYGLYDVDSDIIYISLVLIGLLDYDGNYYEYVQQTYSSLYDKHSDQIIAGKIRDVINKYKIGQSEETRIINEALRNTIVPRKFLPSFFDFIFDIYKLNFEYSIDPESDLKEEFSFVYEGIQKGLDRDTDELNLNVTSKTYTLCKTTKDLLLDENKVKSLIDLSCAVAKIIDKDYWSDSSLEIVNQYFKYGYDNWKIKLDKSNSIRENKKSELRSKWEPDFKLDGSKVLLNIPNHKIRSSYDYSKLKIQIFNGDELIAEKDRLDVFEIIGGYRIENPIIELKNPLGQIKYLLKCDEEVIYDSKDKLYRNFIMFNPTGVELKNNRDFDGDVRLCSKDGNNESSVMYKTDNYVITSMKVSVGEYYKVGEEIFNFTTILKPGIIGKEHDARAVIDNTKINIYSEIQGIVYESEKTINNIVLTINGKRNKFSDLDVDKKTRGLYNNYFIKLDLNNDNYDIVVEELIDSEYKATKEFKFILDKDFAYSIRQNSNIEYSVDINCLNNAYSKKVTTDIDDINKIEFDDLSFIIPINIPIFKVDNEIWHSLDLNSYIWLDDITNYSNLRINGFYYTKACVCNDDGDILTTIYSSTIDYYIDLSIESLISYKSLKHIRIDFYNETNKVGFINCYGEIRVNENKTKFEFINGKLEGKVSLIGKGNIYANVYDKEDNIVFFTQVQHNELITIDNLKSFNKYRLDIIEKKQGFTLGNREKTIYTTNLEYYDKDDFVGKTFSLYLVNFDQRIYDAQKKDYVFTRKETRLKFNYIKLIERIDENTFTGEIYKIVEGTRYAFKKLNPVEVEFTSDINNGHIEASITKDGDGLLLDFKNKSIHGNIDDNLTDIFSYDIDLGRRKQ